MEPKVEQFNNFSGGISSNLRANYETPKFARLWNFDVSNDRAIQRYGWKKMDNEPGAALINYTTGLPFILSPSGVSSNPAQETSKIISLPSSGEGKQWVNRCNIDSTEDSYDLGEVVDTGTIPQVYNNAVIYRNISGEIKYRRFGGQGVGVVLSGITTYTNTFLVEGADEFMYVFTGKDLHGFKMLGKDPVTGDYFGSSTSQLSQISQYQPITQYMKQGDQDGSPGTYLVGGIAIGYTITQVGQLQNLLAALLDKSGNPYYSGSIDGVFGAALDTAVKAFQNDYEATGEQLQTSGTGLVVDGLVGPETSSTLSKPLDSIAEFIEQKDILNMNYNITAVTQVGGSIAFATKEDDGMAKVYIWDMTKDINNKGLIGLKTVTKVGLGTIQALDVLGGNLIAIMSPFNTDSCSAPYAELSFYIIQSVFDYFPESYVKPLTTLRLRQSPDSNLDNDNDIEYGRYNHINRKTEVNNGRLYFSGRLHLESNRDDLGDDEGAMAGLFSLDLNGNIVFEASVPDELTDAVSVESFAFNNGGFWLSTKEGTFKTSYSEDQKSGLITRIINGGQPWRNKSIENICLAFDNTDDLDNVEIYLREAMDKHDNDAGWVKVYDDETSEERRNFKNRIIINRNTIDNKRFNHFRELQVMVIIDGKGVELVDLTIFYNMLDLNK